MRSNSVQQVRPSPSDHHRTSQAHRHSPTTRRRAMTKGLRVAVFITKIFDQTLFLGFDMVCIYGLHLEGVTSHDMESKHTNTNMVRQILFEIWVTLRFAFHYRNFQANLMQIWGAIPIETLPGPNADPAELVKTHVQGINAPSGQTGKMRPTPCA